MSRRTELCRGRTGGRLAVIAGSAGALVMAGALEAQAGPETIRTDAAGGEIELVVLRHRGYPVVHAAELFGALRSGASRSGSVVSAELAGRPLVLRAGYPFLEFDGRIYQLANPPYEQGGAFWVPAELVSDWWPRVRESNPAGAPEVVAPAPVASRVDGSWRVIIDAGHGGKDPGSLGRRGTREKDVVLGIARHLAEELSDEPGVEAILTRDTDVYTPLRRRSQFAVERDGDLFVSIHANWFRDGRASGFETYFLSPARTEEAREVAVRENSAARYETEDYQEMTKLDFILAGLDRNENVQEARRAAGYAQNALRQARSTPDRGVKQAGFWVLVGASGTMPAILVEVGFLSNSDEERVLRGESGQRQVAASLAEGILAYRDYLKRQYDRVTEGSSH